MQNYKCPGFVCRYVSTCLVGVDCENGAAQKCRLNFCDICVFSKKCKFESAVSNIKRNIHG